MAAENGRGGGLIYRTHENALVPTPAATDDGETDWSGWERWLRGHLAIERAAIGDEVGDAIGELISEERAANERVIADLKRAVREIEVKIAECSGAVNVLRTGKTMRVRGTFIPGTRYEQLDVVAMDGSSFVATEDAPGPCPGKGWQLLAKAGSRGARGFDGPRGERGDAATAGPGFNAFHVDPKTYILSIITTDGRVHALPLRGLFEQFVRDLREGR
jgi:hypothetical protein